MAKINVLLLTNRDSDNVGDQIIEATAISLLKAAFANLGLRERDIAISSRAAGIITKAYMRTKDPKLLKGARRAISSANLIVFGGAPLFNYSYQSFFRRTIVTLELAQEYGVPAIFSSIGVEPYNPANKKSVALKQALSLPVVRQITTRDDYESLARYVEGTQIPIARVSDPAVFADIVFRTLPASAAAPTSPARRVARRLLSRDSNPAPAARADSHRPRIGLVPTRAGIFKDNRIDFDAQQQEQFWLDVIEQLTARGHDYAIFTTGHFSDEEFVDALVTAHDIPAEKVTRRVNSPEELIRAITACDGIIAYRLHASITAFAFEVPSIGLSWNFKVPHFYDSVGLGERALDHTRWNAKEVVDALERAMDGGIRKDQEFLMSVYETLFSGIKAVLRPHSDREPYGYADLRAALPPYPGTTHAMYQEKLFRKQRRADTHHGQRQPTAPRGLARLRGGLGYAVRLVRRII